MVIAFFLPGGVPVYTFSLLVGLGAGVGLAWVAWRAAGLPPTGTVQRVNAGLWTLIGALLGSRAAYVAVNWAYFKTHLGEAPQVQLGGLAWPGALAGGLVFLAIYAALARQPLGVLADALLPLAASLTVSVWLGCWVLGSAYGPPLAAWWAVPARDEGGHLAGRFPTQPLGALLALGLAWLLDLNWHFRRPGIASGLWLGGFALQLLAISLLRGDPAPGWQGLRLETWAALGFTALAALGLLLLYLRTDKP